MDFSELYHAVNQIVDSQRQFILNMLQKPPTSPPLWTAASGEVFETPEKLPYLIMQETNYFSGAEEIVVSIDLFHSLPDEAKAKLHQQYAKRIVSSPVNPKEGRRRIKFHQHDFFEIVYVYQGGCINVVSGKQRHLVAGDFCLFNLAALHSITLDDEHSVVINILIKKSLFESIFVNMLSASSPIQHFYINSLFLHDPNQRTIYLNCRPGSTVEFYLLQLILGYNSDEPSDQNTLKALLICFLNDLAKEHKENLEQSVLQETGRSFSSILSYIGSHYQTATPESIAEHFHYNKQYLSNLILKETGQTLSQIIRSSKLKQAADYIADTNIPIAKIVELVGDNDRSHFDKAFKQKYLITPAQYRKKYLHL